jgi:hypothetical protein
VSDPTRPAARHDPRQTPVPRGARLAVAALAAILLVSLVPMSFWTISALVRGDLESLLFYLVFLLLPASLGLVGCLLAVRRPENRVGWLLLVSGTLAGLAFASGEYVRIASDAARPDWPLYIPAAWIAAWGFIPAIGILVVFLPLV